MLTYDLPIKDIQTLFQEVLDLEGVLNLPGYEHCDPETANAIVEAIGRYAKDVLLPLNQVGDRVGSKLEPSGVSAAPGFKQAYETFCNDGWNGLPLELSDGGQQLPFLLHAVLREAIASSNLAFALIHELNFGVYEVLQAYGSPALRETYLAKLAHGKWAGTMCLTEPHCGTDLGLIRTSAKPQSDGTYALRGDKIFITWGDHDMSENIVHLVLARVAGAAPGTKGLSLFIVPKYLPDEDGQPGDPNGVVAVGVENKMGLHGSPTCAISFDHSKGWLVGAEGRGLAGMFVMMNAARLSVGLQALGIAETAYQNARAYAEERLQGRGPDGAEFPDQAADPLIVHPDVQRRINIMQAEVITARALCYWGATLLDRSHRSPDEQERSRAVSWISSLTPMLKSYVSDLGSRVAHEAVQMFGGHGYVKDHGVEQLSRDVRITEIYEGTNAIQAIDLVIRKLRKSDGEAVYQFIDAVIQTADRGDNSTLKDAAARLRRATQYMLETSARDALEKSTYFLDLCAITLAAMMAQRLASADPAQSQVLDTYMRHVLPRTLPLAAMIEVPDVQAADAKEERVA